MTQLFLGGQLLAKERWNYQPLVDGPMPEHQISHRVQEQMKAQHIGMLRRVAEGEFDQSSPLQFHKVEASPHVIPATPRRRSPSSPHAARTLASDRRRMPSTSTTDIDEQILREIDVELLRHEQAWNATSPRRLSSTRASEATTADTGALLTLPPPGLPALPPTEEDDD
ncbi:MAG: hypothetical protein KTR25_03325 [Myxococcales bacterium]|nr:hypothetical protein [Myxococcales bacterium]